VGVLLSAAPEAAAVAFGVHPELVHRAREAAGSAPCADELARRRAPAPA
jgi:hypothetical protein